MTEPSTCPICQSYQHGRCNKRFNNQQAYFMTGRDCPAFTYWAVLGKELLSLDDSFVEPEVEKLSKRLEIL